MPIYRKAKPDEVHERYVTTRTDVPGHEFGTVHHGGSCPLRGLSLAGIRGPGCGTACEGGHGILVAVTHQFMVLATDAQTVTTWDFIRRRPVTTPLDADPVFPAYAEVDAPPKLQQMYQSWLTWREIEKDFREKRAQDQARAAMLEEEKKRNLAWAALTAEAARLQEQADRQRRRHLSNIKRGSVVVIVEDPPGFAERNRRSKPKNRTPSAVRARGTVEVPGSVREPYVFIRIETGVTLRVLRSTIRVVLPDGSVGDPDVD